MYEIRTYSVMKNCMIDHQTGVIHLPNLKTEDLERFITLFEYPNKKGIKVYM